VYELLVMAAYPATQRFITTLMMMAKHGAFIVPNILFLKTQNFFVLRFSLLGFAVNKNH